MLHLPRRHPALLFGALLVLGVAGSGVALDRLADAAPTPFSHPASSTPEQRVQRALATVRASWEVRQLAQWVIENQDNRHAPFLVVDKSQARLYAFDERGDLVASSDVLLGTLRSDDVEAAATPAGRYTAQDRGGPMARLVWANAETERERYGARSGPQTPGRAGWRLASDRLEDKRISDGSLHVAPDFFREHLAGLRGRPSTLYVLPEAVPRLRMASTTRPAPIRRPS